MSNLGKIVIPISNEIRTKYDIDINQGLFDPDYDLLTLWIQPGDYNVTNSYTAGESNRGFSSVTVLLQEKVFIAEINIKDQRIAIYKILKELIDNATADPTKYELITIHDYCFLDTETDENNGYTVRNGILKVDVQGFNFIGRTQYTQGLSLVFEQVSTG